MSLLHLPGAASEGAYARRAALEELSAALERCAALEAELDLACAQADAAEQRLATGDAGARPSPALAPPEGLLVALEDAAQGLRAARRAEWEEAERQARARVEAARREAQEIAAQARAGALEALGHASAPAPARAAPSPPGDPRHEGDRPPQPPSPSGGPTPVAPAADHDGARDAAFESFFAAPIDNAPAEQPIWVGPLRTVAMMLALFVLLALILALVG